MKLFHSPFTLSLYLFMFVCTLIIAGCSGGGSGGGGGADLTEANSPEAVGAVMEGISFLGISSTLQGQGGLAKGVSGSKPPLRHIIDRALSYPKDYVSVSSPNSLYKSLASSRSATVTCAEGGIISISGIWDGPAQPVDDSEIVDLHLTLKFTVCNEDGSMISGTLSLIFNGPLNAPLGFTITVRNLFYVDGLTGDHFSMDRFTIVATDIAFDENGELTEGTIILDGVAEGTVEGDAIDMEVDNLQIAFSTSVNGELVSISGRIRAICLRGWITVETVTPLFTPSGEDCPLYGEVTITSGENEVRLVIDTAYPIPEDPSSPVTSITIYFNGDPVQSYNDCNNVEGLCA